MPIQFDDADAAKTALATAAARMIATRDSAVGLGDLYVAAVTDMGRLLRRAAGGESVADSEFDAADDTVLKLSRRAARLKIIARLQLKELDEINTAAAPLLRGQEAAQASLEAPHTRTEARAVQPPSDAARGVEQQSESDDEDDAGA